MGSKIYATAFFGKTYDDALKLLVEVRDYLEAYQPNQAKQTEPAIRLALTCLTMRLTAQLTDIMAWLLVQKAVHTGEMHSDEGKEGRNSLRRWIDFDPEQTKLPIPGKLKSLLDRSQTLFERVERLEVMINQK